MKRFLILALILLASTAGCERRRTIVRNRTNVQSSNFLLDSSAFNLGLVTQMIRSNEVSNAEQLEVLVNSDNGINNVDLDADGNIDYISVQESDRGKLDFVAMPATKGETGATTIAQVSVSRNTSTNEVVISGAYPSYVRGYEDCYEYRSPSIGQLLFASYVLDVTRPRYYHSYSYYRARPAFVTTRRVYTPSRLRTTRRTVTTRIKVKPARIVKRPKTYTIQSATKTKSRFAAKRATGASLSGRRGVARSYKARSTTKTKAKGSAFGKVKTTTKNKTKSKSWGSSSSKRKSSWNKPKTKKKSSWGSNSRKKSSWGSRSSRKKSSWGSSRSRSRSRSRRRH